MKLINTVFETMSPIFIFLTIGSLVIWMLNGGINDWGVIHKISMSMALVGLLCAILTVLFCMAYGTFYLVRWIYQEALK